MMLSLQGHWQFNSRRKKDGAAESGTEKDNRYKLRSEKVKWAVKGCKGLSKRGGEKARPAW